MKNQKLTQERVRELLDYDPKTGLLTWTHRVLYRNRKSLKGGRLAGCKSTDGYIALGIDRKLYRAHRVIWLWYYGYLPENQIDHINKNRSDNRLSNLREVSCQCNNRNSGNPCHNTSGVKGVTWKSNPKLWASQIQISGKSKHIGYYKNFDDAVCARLAVEQCIGWANCDSSSPAFQYVQRMLNEK